MIYKKVVTGEFVDRPNRFIAHVLIEGKLCTVHVKNTGRCRELLLPGVKVILEDFRNSSLNKTRKTDFDLIAVYKQINSSNPLFKQITEKKTDSVKLQNSEYTDFDNSTQKQLLINMDSQAPNKVVMEWLIKKNCYDFIKPEYVFGQSRIDFYMEKQNQKFLLEVKGCTLEKDGIGYFPDAPTERGVKHLYELQKSISLGYSAAVGFVIQMEGVQKVLPNVQTHPEFAQALQNAQNAGVKVIYFLTKVTESGMEIVSQIEN